MRHMRQTASVHLHAQVMKPEFKWQTVTGSDYGRAIRWARAQPNLADMLAKKHEAEISVERAKLNLRLAMSKLEDAALDEQLSRARVIISVVETEWGIEPGAILSRSRLRSVAEARFVAMFCSRELTALTLRQIGYLFGRGIHGVVYALATTRDMIDTNPRFAGRVERMREQLTIKREVA